MDAAVTLLPQPDSPTIPRISPTAMSKLTSWTTTISVAPFVKATDKSDTFSSWANGRESGGVAAQFHMPSAIEPYSAEILAADRHVALGKKSGLANIKIKLAELGLDAPPDKHGAILEKVKTLGTTQKRLVTDQEFRTIVAQVV